MATLIKCPACETRYEVKAAFPPEGRKVRCSKCSHVWQAKPVGAGAPAATPVPQTAAAPPAPPQPAPAPQAAPQAPTPPAPPLPPQAAPAQPPAPEPAPPPPLPQAAPPPGLPPTTQADAEFGGVDLGAQAAQMNAETEAAPPPEPTVAKQGGLFAKIMGKRASAKPPAPEAPPPDIAPPEAAPPPPPPEASFTEAAQADAGFDAGFPEDQQADAALADPALVAAAFGKAPPKAPRKPLPIVAIGWGILALIVLIVVSLFAFAPGTTVSMLPGAARIYSLLGMPVGANGLAFEGVRYGWTNDGSQTVLEVQGNVRNTSSATMTVPTVIIALRDEKGEEISEWTTEVGSAELSAGEEAPFLRQIPSPPSNVRSLKVRFAGAS